MNLPDKFNVLIITLSDRAHRGEYEDKSGPHISKKLSEWFREEGYAFEINHTLIPDDASMLENLVRSAGAVYNIVFTTGGTGIGPRDITTDTIQPLLSKEIPGIMEYIRIRYGEQNPGALLSRSIAGVTGNALLYALPGSLKAVDEYMTEILRTLKHAIYMQYGIDSHGNH